jgi:peptide deformylase
MMGAPKSFFTALPAEVTERKWRLARLSLVLHPDAVLRELCPPVEGFDSTLGDLFQEMCDLMLAHRGIGLAAPQVAVKQRLLVCQIAARQLRLTNPEVQAAGTSGIMTEGCLSLPDVQVTISRPERIQVKGYDDHGRQRRFDATGLWARVIQHELDHLNGVLILDHGPLVAQGHVAVSGEPPASLVELPLRRCAEDDANCLSSLRINRFAQSTTHPICRSARCVSSSARWWCGQRPGAGRPRRDSGHKQ